MSVLSTQEVGPIFGPCNYTRPIYEPNGPCRPPLIVSSSRRWTTDAGDWNELDRSAPIHRSAGDECCFQQHQVLEHRRVIFSGLGVSFRAVQTHLKKSLAFQLFFKTKSLSSQNFSFFLGFYLFRSKVLLFQVKICKFI